MLQAWYQDQDALLCQFLSTSDQSDPNDKPKCDFGVKLRQILNFDLSIKFAIFEKTALQACYQGQVASLCQFVSGSNARHSNNITFNI